MPLTVDNLKNKFKRLVIEIHHQKNRLGLREHIITQRDPKKPLLTLRVEGNYLDEEDQDEEATLNNDFEGFSSGNSEGLGNDDVEHQGQMSRLSSFERRDSYHSSRPLTPIVTNSGVDQASSRLEMESHRKRLEQSLQTNINYIHQKELPPRRRFWLFGKRYHNLNKKNFNEEVKPIELIDQDKSECSTLNNILLIAHSSVGPDEQVNETAEGNSPLASLNKKEKFSSYSRKKHNTSLISLSSKPSTRENCRCATCQKKQQQPIEPWKVIMNDISLHAALLSTGSKPQFQYDPFNNIVADFTSSKHQILSRNLFSKESIPSDLMSFTTDAPLNIGQLAVLNDENRVLDYDLLELSKPTTRRQQSVNRSRPITKQSVNSIISEPMKTGQPTSEPYDDVFQNYDYSDESANIREKMNTSLETEPLRISHRGAKRLF